MPSALPSTFASAAAGSNSDASATRSRNEGSGYADWSRRPNGATHTFRRTSSIANTPTLSTQRESSNVSQPATTGQLSSAYVPPHVARTGAVNDTRYAKSMLLDIFKEQKAIGDLGEDIGDLVVGDWLPSLTSATDTSRWNRRPDSGNDGTNGPDICFLRDSIVEPLGLVAMTDEERELFTTSVNSPLKGPSQHLAREGTPRDAPGVHRKSSIGQNQGTGGLHGLTSPTGATRHQPRRRDTGEFPKDSIASPTSTSRFFRDEPSAAEPPLSLTRRRTDIRDATSSPITEERDQAEGVTSTSSQIPFAPVRRSASNQFGGGLNSPSSPWSSTAPGSNILGGLGSIGSLGGGALAGDKRPGFTRGESRFRSMMSKDGSESLVSPSVEKKGSFGSFQNIKDGQEGEGSSAYLMTGSGDPFTGEKQPSGSAVLGGESPPRNLRQADSGTPHRGLPPFGSGMDPAEYSQQQSGNRGLQYNMAATAENDEPLSPTFTNPYSSPDQQAARLKNLDLNTSEASNMGLQGLGGLQGESMQEPQSAFGDQSFEQRFERGHGSSRGFPGLAGLGAAGSSEQWSAGAFHKGGFDSFGGTSIRSPADLQSPSLAGLGGNAYGNIGRGASRLGSLFPTAMQEQMKTSDHVRRQTDEFGGIGGPRPGRETDSPSRSGRGKFDDFFKPADMSADIDAEQSGMGAPQSMTMDLGEGDQPGGTPALQHMQAHGQPTSANQPPAPQQKTMVMPDRIRWIYRDPQGNTQGPWSGLEMHDWYRAGFFSPELLVKKVEDPDYEPLAQLIRRIGNSREPFLVPQIGIPGPPTGQGTSGWPQATAQPPTSAGPAAQPPFASSFPSFGTTLTAEQQNALERRKQEEQYLMARQKEHLAQQQAMLRQMQAPGQHGMISQQLQHHSSAHSLHSQPSYGSMTPPTGFTQQNVQSPSMGVQGYQGHFDYNSRSRNLGPGQSGAPLEGLEHIQEEPSPNVMQRFDAGAPGLPLQFEGDHQPRVDQALAERVQLEQEQKEAGHLWQQAPNETGLERLKQFQDYRAGLIDEAAHQQPQSVAQMLEAQTQHGGSSLDIGAQQTMSEESADETDEGLAHGASGLKLSLTEQVQKAAFERETPQPQSPWAKVDPGIPMPLPPAQPRSPLPAPAAQRNRSNVADALAAESSPSASPAVETPSASIAPWAKDPMDTSKQPSLREIQEIEARQAAKQEEAAAAARRAALEKELAVQTQAPLPGLPSSSTWGNADSPATPTSSVWAKSATTKAQTSSAAASKMKTLQQIQAEEEARKRKSVSVNAPVATASPTSAQAQAGGKRYADLASKGPQPTAGNSVGGAWHTVGSSGKAKVPGLPSAPSPISSVRSGSGTVGPAPTSRPKPITTQSSSSLPNAQAAAQEEFRKWAIGQLRPQLNKGVQVDEFVSGLLAFPSDTDIITEAVHSVSSTLDSRHFAEEFVRKRALADKGRTEPTSSAPLSAGVSDNKNGGGWSEVARKGPATTPKEESNAFKIVAAKKKSGKR